MDVLEFVGELVDAALVAPTFEVCLEEGFDAGLGHFDADQPRPERNRVRERTECVLRPQPSPSAMGNPKRRHQNGDRWRSAARTKTGESMAGVLGLEALRL